MRKVLLLAAFSAACSSGESAVDPSVMRSDSAGVRIITSTGPDRPLPWRLDTVGVFTDSLGEPWLFTSVSTRDVITDRAGRSYVLEREPAIRRFGRDGRFEMSLGRKGSGPGEMEFPMMLRQQGDTLVVMDAIRRVFVRWNASFEPISDTRIDGPFEGARDLAFRTGGVWIEKQTRDEAQVVSTFQLDTGATDVALRASFPAPPVVTAQCGGGASVSVPLPPFFAPEIVFDAAGGRVLANAGSAYDLHLYEGTRSIARIRRDLTPRAPTADDVRQLYPDGYKVRLGGGMQCEFDLEQLLQNGGMAAEVPLVQEVALLSDGTMWVQRSLRSVDPIVLDVFGSDGAYVGTLSGHGLPVGLLPNGEVLFPLEDEASGGTVIARIRITR